jgi:DpnII restriction endonuclease
VEAEALFEMASAAARNAERNCTPSGSTQMFYESYGGYPAYVQEYNRLAPIAWELYGVEAQQLFPALDIGRAANPAETPGAMWKTFAELAAARLAALAAYLKSKQGTKRREYDEIASIIDDNLRAAVYSDPKNERDVQDVIDTIFRVRGLDYRREQQGVPYSSKRYVPDFTFDALGVAVEVKFCNRAAREKEMIDEINADIIGYQGSYDRILFVIYDLGFIRDVALFKSSIELQPGVQVMIIKK